MSEERSHHSRGRLLPIALFSSTIIALVVSSLVKMTMVCNCDDELVADLWQSPSEVMISDVLYTVRYPEHTISPYDHLFREICEEHGTDWRLMSAIAYAESRFESHAISHYGARGLMQVLPRSAAPYNITEDMLHDPRTNILAANMIFKHIEEMLALPDDTSDRDKMCLILAAYNCGIGRVFDAQRLAQSEGRDRCKWRDISYYLSQLRSSEYHTRDEVYHGRFSGGMRTRAYVNIVIYTYDSYCRQNQQEPWQFVWR